MYESAGASGYSLLESVEQKLNSVTHGIGAGLAIAALILLAGRAQGAVLITVLAVYGGCQVFLYLSSALTHAFFDMTRTYGVLRIIDQAGVYLLIAGTYTPVALVVVGGSTGWIMFGLEWGMALAGILAKSIFFRGKHIASDLLYLPMGWLILFFLPAVLAAAPSGMLLRVLAGGICYTLGIAFYLIKRIPLGHVIWHLWVMAGGICFFTAFLRYLV